MKVQEVMTADVMLAHPSQTIREAAELMLRCDLGVLPVGEADQLVGMITDRDIAVRAVAVGLTPDTKIGEVMTREVKYCFDDEDLDDVATNMAFLRVRRLPVLNRHKRLIGIVSLGDLTACGDADVAGEAVAGVTVPGGQHCQQARH